MPAWGQPGQASSIGYSSRVDASCRSRKLVLVRHGPSAHTHSGWVDTNGVRAWRVAYEAAGIRDDSQPPPALVRDTADAGLVLARDARRAIDSARRLAPDREVIASALLRELDLEPPDLGRIRLPLRAWALAIGLHGALLALAEKGSSQSERGRVRDAIAWLETLARDHASILVVTHAMIRKRLFVELVRGGWKPDRGSRSLADWSAWTVRSDRA